MTRRNPKDEDGLRVPAKGMVRSYLYIQLFLSFPFD